MMRGDRGDHVAHPPEEPAGADPQAGRDDQPEDATEKIAVVELPQARKDRAENGGGAGIAGGAHSSPIVERRARLPCLPRPPRLPVRGSSSDSRAHPISTF